jgi:phage terminase large subunit
MKIRLSNSFEPLLHDAHRYLVLCGGRGSGKSEFAARKIFYRCMTEGGHRFLILRKVRKTCKESVVRVMRTLFRENNVEFTYNKTDHVMSFAGPDGRINELIFDGLDEPEKIKSIKAISGIWIEEATEFSARDFEEVDLCFREPSAGYKQIILSFNPDEAEAKWLKLRFFDNIDPSARVHLSTVEDNPIQALRDEYRRQLDGIQDETLRAIYRYGVWATPKGRIYNWDVQELPAIKFDEVFYGGDFGYSVNPSVIVRIYRKANEYWLEEVLYQSGLTNQDIGAIVKGNPTINDQDPCYWDSAEQKSIEELYRFGLNAKSAIKGPDSVRAGIDFLKSQKIHIIAGSVNIIREAGHYKWRTDKSGDPLPEPVKFDDHALDAIRYGIYTHAKEADGMICAFSEEAVY